MGLLDVFRRKPPARPATAADTAPAAGGYRGFDAVYNAVAGLGTERDKRYYTSYGAVYRLTQYQIDAMYEGSWLAGKIVDIPAGDMTRQWVSRTWDGVDDGAGGRKALTTAETALDVPGKVLEALTWERKDGGSMIFMAIAGDLDVSLPLDVTRIRKGSLRNLVVFERSEITPSQELDADPNSRNIGQPLYYTTVSGSVRIHWSRLIRFPGSLIPKQARRANYGWGGSVLQKVADAIANFDGSHSVSGSMLYEATIDVLKIAELYKLLSPASGESQVAARFQAAMLMKGVTRTLLLDKADDYEKKVMSFAGVREIMQEFAVAVCGAADIPMTRVFGQSPGGLNATGKSDLDNYDDKIKAEQQRQLLPRIRHLDEVLLPSVLGRMPQDYDVVANPLRQMSDAEQADLENKRADRDKKYFDMGVLTAGAIARELNQEGTYHTMTEDDVALAEEADEAKAEARENAAQAFGAAAGGDDDPAGGDSPPDDGDDPTKATPPAGKDSLPGDKIEHKDDGWHAYAAGKHIGGPYKTRAKAMRTLRRHEKYDRR
jgi:uncharacterized protein